MTDTEDDLICALPELIKLQDIIECSDWHDDSPFDQSLRLHRWVKQLPASVPGTTVVETEIMQTALGQRIDASNGRYTAQELLAFVALVHDVGKRDTWTLAEKGLTVCPGHEAASARMARAICDRFDLTAAEKDYVVRLVAAHGEPYALYKRIAHLPAPEQTDHLRRFEDAWGDDLLLLLLLAYGDLVTSHLSQRRPEKYAAILAFYQAWLHRLMNPADRHGRGENHEARSGPG